MPSFMDTFGPSGWKPFIDSGGVIISGLFCRELRNTKQGSSFLLLRFESGARYGGPPQKAFQLTLIEGALDYASQDKTGKHTQRFSKGAYADCGRDSTHEFTSVGVTTALVTY